MKKNISLTPQIGQFRKLALSPQFIQTQKLLQINRVDLIDYLDHQLSENPFLEEEHEAFDQERAEAGEEVAFSREKVSSSDLLEMFPRNSKESLVSKTDVIEKTQAQHLKSLSEELLEQLSLVFDHQDQRYQVGIKIISCLNQEGFFETRFVAPIASTCKVELETVESVLSVIQTFEPPGIAANDLQHSLIMQTKRLEQESRLAMKLEPLHQDKITSERDFLGWELKILTEAFDLLIKKNHREIKNRLKIPDSFLDQALKNISLLNPRPSSFYQVKTNSYILPDASVIERGGQLEILVMREWIPRIQFSQAKLDQWKREKNLQSKNQAFQEYVEDKEQSAKAIVAAVKYRETNLVKVLKKLVEIQEKFFRLGYDHLIPYTLTQLATELDLDKGTLSRLVNQKHIYTQWGLVSLRTLFTSSIKKENHQISSLKIKRLIEKMILDFPDKKLSDQRITNALNRQGYQISRRTVTKYRSSLNLLSSHERKQSHR